ncbi:MAG: hypothetical protein K9N51_09555, partial [Candidatus Pacebacteria bacterium]|nr:hypothetical protein [Candidatus Paceibacterota bacterium]
MPDHVNAVLRAATPQDIEKLLELLTPPAEAGLILPRSRDELHKSIHCFTVAELDNRLVGCVARRDFGNGLVEIRSLVVDSAWQ